MDKTYAQHLADEMLKVAEEIAAKENRPVDSYSDVNAALIIVFAREFIRQQEQINFLLNTQSPIGEVH